MVGNAISKCSNFGCQKHDTIEFECWKFISECSTLRFGGCAKLLSQKNNMGESEG